MFWGDTPLDGWVAGKILPDATLDAIVRVAMERGVTFFDTAEGYGGGTSEIRLAAACRRATQQLAPLNNPLQHLEEPNTSVRAHAPCMQSTASTASSPILATKFLPTLWRWTEGAFLDALDASNARLGITCCPLYFIHSPIHPRAIEVWVRAASRAIAAGKMSTLGLSNFDAPQVRRAVAEAKKCGNVPIVANQLMFNLMVAGSPKVQETLTVCKEHNITIIAYSPLGQGLLCDVKEAAPHEQASGTAQPAPAPPSSTQNRLLRMTGLRREDLESLRCAVQHIAVNRGVPMAHVAINYVRAKGAIPLVGCRSPAHVSDAVDAVQWSLNETEVATLDQLVLAKHTFEKPKWRRSLFVVFISVLMTMYRVSNGIRSAKQFLSRCCCCCSENEHSKEN